MRVEVGQQQMIFIRCAFRAIMNELAGLRNKKVMILKFEFITDKQHF